MNPHLIQIGTIGVDSGQALLCDPCYIESEWQDTPFRDIRRYQDKATGRIYQLDLMGDDQDTLPDTNETFGNYQEQLPTGKTPNQHLADGDWEKLEDPDANPLGEFSYGGCCASTLSSGSGQLNYQMGHAGAGVVFNTGYGDGLYPVYARHGEDGRIARVEVAFCEEMDATLAEEAELLSQLKQWAATFRKEVSPLNPDYSGPEECKYRNKPNVGYREYDEAYNIAAEALSELVLNHYPEPQPQATP